MKMTKYTIFKTRWGYFGLAGTDSAICRTQLPDQNRQKLKSRLLKNLPNPQYDKSFFRTTQNRIIAYFQGKTVNFSTALPLELDGFSQFHLSVLSACRQIRFGQITTYSKLAKMIDNPAASRAVGTALSKNPIPLIIPCHRIIRTDAKLGGFSAPGGLSLKKRLLEHEKH